MALPPRLLLGGLIANLLLLPLWWSVFPLFPYFASIPASVLPVTSLFLFIALGLLLAALTSVQRESLQGPIGWIILDLAFLEGLVAFGCSFVIAYSLAQPPPII